MVNRVSSSFNVIIKLYVAFVMRSFEVRVQSCDLMSVSLLLRLVN